MEPVRLKILEPTKSWWQHSGIVAATAAILARGTVLLYEVIGQDGISRIGRADSQDGERFIATERPYLEDFQDRDERLGVGDPKLIQLDRKLRLTVTARSVESVLDLKTDSQTETVPRRNRLIITTLADQSPPSVTARPIPNVNANNGLLFPEAIQRQYWLAYCLDNQIFVSLSPNLRSWSGGLRLATGEKSWETGGITPAAVVATERGWLFFYNAVDGRGHSSVGVLLLDPRNPAFIIRRSAEPILKASEAWEKGSLTLGAALLLQGNIWFYYAAGGSAGLTKMPLDQITTTLNG